MSYKSFSDFIKDTTDNAIKYMNHKNVCNKLQTSSWSEAGKVLYHLIKDGQKEAISNTLIRHCNEALKHTKKGSDLYRKIAAYIDGATEFYYQAPSADIKEKHILGEDPNKLQQELRSIQDIAFEDFCKLIESFNNKELNHYLKKKIATEGEKTCFCPTNDPHINSIPQSLFPTNTMQQLKAIEKHDGRIVPNSLHRLQSKPCIIF